MRTKPTRANRATASNSPPARAGEFESVAAILERVLLARGEGCAELVGRARSDGGRADGQRDSEAYEPVNTT
jgi:hypothetical protein